VRADCTLLLARAHHALGATAEARKHYLAAAKLDPAAALPHLGMAQMYLAEGSIDFRGQAVNATTELEAALKTSPAFFDALKVGAGVSQEGVQQVLPSQLIVCVTQSNGTLWENSTGQHAELRSDCRNLQVIAPVPHCVGPPLCKSLTIGGHPLWCRSLVTWCQATRTR
jgi:hypothetical protein